MARGGGLSPFSVFSTVRGMRNTPPGGAIVVDGAPALVAVLARELRAGGDPAAVHEGSMSVEDRAVVVWIGEPDEAVLREVSLARIPIMAVSEADTLPYVLATDIVHARPGEGFPIDEIAAVIARKVGGRGPSLAKALPVLREAVVDELIRSASRTNAFLGATLALPGADMPVLTVNQIRLVMNIAVSYGREIDRSRAAEVLSVIGAGYTFRAVARQALTALPVAGWAVKGAVAYAGTQSVGEAARSYFSTDSTSELGSRSPAPTDARKTRTS